MNRDLFFEYDVFFFGTARRTESHKSSKRVGTFEWITEGTEKETDDKIG
jgi:hypothetical protein